MSVRYLAGDVRDVLRTLPDQSVHCVVTSPPYWGLRDYGVEGQLGREAHPDEYVANLVAVFREVRRVLRDDGTVWLNIGDSYAGSGPSGASYQSATTKARAGKTEDGSFRISKTLGERGLTYRDKKPIPPAGLKSKDLVGIPWRVAFALQADGWYLRSDIIWAKPNPMPESVTDRPTRAHEYVFLLSKRKRYYYDRDAVSEPVAAKTLTVRTTPRKGTGTESTGEKLNAWMETHGGRYHPTRRNLRSVWTMTNRPFKGAHFATFPITLPLTCIKAGTSEYGVCAACGAPYTRRIEKGTPDLAHQRACGADAAGGYAGQATKDYASAGAQDASATKASILAGMVERRTVGWDETCTCEADIEPAVVLDPFGGAGTTALAAQQLGRRAILIDLNQSYLDMAKDRIEGRPTHTHPDKQAALNRRMAGFNQRWREATA